MKRWFQKVLPHQTVHAALIIACKNTVLVSVYFVYLYLINCVPFCNTKALPTHIFRNLIKSSGQCVVSCCHTIILPMIQQIFIFYLCTALSNAMLVESCQMHGSILFTRWQHQSNNDCPAISRDAVREFGHVYQFEIFGSRNTITSNKWLGR